MLPFDASMRYPTEIEGLAANHYHDVRLLRYGKAFKEPSFALGRRPTMLSAGTDSKDQT